MTVWIAIVSVAFGTYLMRASLIVLLGRLELPHRFERSLRYIAPAVLAAIVAPSFVAGSAPDRPLAPIMVAAVVGVALAWRFRTIPAVLGGGLVAYHLTGWLVDATPAVTALG